MNGLRDQQLHFRVSKQELERIWSKMESSGILSIGSYLRKMDLLVTVLRHRASPSLSK